MPADRVQKSRSPQEVPRLGDPDRKRALNVLAQRRYRQRRREKIAALEAQAKGLEGLVGQCSTSNDGASPQASSNSVASMRLDAVQDLSENGDHIEEIINIPCEDAFSDIAILGDPFHLASVQDFSYFSTLPTPLPSTQSPTETHPTPKSPTFSFPLTADSGTLTLPVMNLVQTLLSIATALNICDKLWDPSYLHVLPSSASLPLSLPRNLHPIPAQLLIPHHPAIDILPWPTMRQKLICTLAMPNKLRPPIAREDEDDDDAQWQRLDSFSTSSPPAQSTAISQLVQDIDDFQDGGGLRVHGNSVAWGLGNELVEEAWEVGEAFYRRWWFCLDEKIVAQSNRRRRERGLGRLRLTA